MLSLEQEQTQGKKCFIALLSHIPGALHESLLATFQYVGPCYLAGLENFSRKVPVRKKTPYVLLSTLKFISRMCPSQRNFHLGRAGINLLSSPGLNASSGLLYFGI